MRIGVFIVPGGEDPAATVEQIVTADRAGLDFAGVQDHPYQRSFLDTWTLLSYAAARTERITLLPDVLNLPLRQPAVLAKAATSLDVLSGGRVELGLGAGAFWDGVEAMGGPRRTPGESVSALEEAVTLIHTFFRGETLRQEGEFYSAAGGQAGAGARAPDRALDRRLRAADAAAHRAARRRLAALGRWPLHERARRARQPGRDRRGGRARRAGPGARSCGRRTSASTTRPSSSTRERLARIATELRFEVALVQRPGGRPARVHPPARRGDRAAGAGARGGRLKRRAAG